MTADFNGFMLESLSEYLGPGTLVILLPLLLILGIWWLVSENNYNPQEDPKEEKSEE